MPPIFRRCVCDLTPCALPARECHCSISLSSPEFSDDWGTRRYQRAYFVSPIHHFHQGSHLAVFTAGSLWPNIAPSGRWRADAHLMQKRRPSLWPHYLLSQSLNCCPVIYSSHWPAACSHPCWSFRRMVVTPARRCLFGLDWDYSATVLFGCRRICLPVGDPRKAPTTFRCEMLVRDRVHPPTDSPFCCARYRRCIGNVLSLSPKPRRRAIAVTHARRPRSELSLAASPPS